MKILAHLLALSAVCHARRFSYLTADEETALEDKQLAKRQTSDTAIYPPHYFDQLVDHFPGAARYAPTVNKTFKQRYYFDSSYYKPGGPVILYIGGETSGPSRFEFMQTGIIKILMEATNGLGIILENRFYGRSYPFNLSTTDNLRFFTTEQTIADNAYFAQHATFPGVKGNSSLNAPDSAWILYGGSLAGSQTAFSLKEYGKYTGGVIYVASLHILSTIPTVSETYADPPTHRFEGGDDGILWAGIAASGTTKAKLGYPQWYAPIQKYGPQDCIASINGIVKNIDYVFSTGNQTLINKMKSLFGMETLYDGDFAQAIAFPIGGPLDYPTCTWQELNWDPLNQCPDFWYFCGNVTNLYAPSHITEVDYALSEVTNGEPWPNLGNYANYIKKYVNPICTDTGLPLNHTPFAGAYCFGTQNETWYADVRNRADRSYLWTTCTEGGLYQVAPEHGPSLISNVLDVNYTQQWCEWSFKPGKYISIPSTPDLEQINKYGGYAVVQKRLARVDGDQDVWGDVCYHSTDAPLRFSPNLTEEINHPELLIAGGGHHWDSYGQGGLANVSLAPQFIMQAQLWEVRTVRTWMMEWHATRGSNTSKASYHW